MIRNAIAKAGEALRTHSHLVPPDNWQALDVSHLTHMATYEILNHSFTVGVPTEDPHKLATIIGPNLPWADEHFEERVSGIPYNPPPSHVRWPWARTTKNKAFVDKDEKFSHTYPERFWPKVSNNRAMVGIRYEYGDLNDVVNHLVAHPRSRQAFLPIFFPEDTGKTDVRVPCTLGYHFIQRHGYLHSTYYIRSCDYLRHFRDDVYMAIRLQLWVLEQLRRCDPFWLTVKPGFFTMHIVSLHIFLNDYKKLFGETRSDQDALLEALR